MEPHSNNKSKGCLVQRNLVHFSTPEFRFCTWLSMLNRLTTCDYMAHCNAEIDTACVLCCQHQETQNHLIFSYKYSSAVWYKLTSTLLGNEYTSQWEELVDYVSKETTPKIRLFCVSGHCIHDLEREKCSETWGQIPLGYNHVQDN